MKKIYLLALSLLTVVGINAQTSYTLTQSNSEPVIGDSFVPRLIDTTTAMPLGLTGNNVTWSFTGLLDSLSTDTNKFISPSADPNSSNYAGVTLVQTSPNNVSYFKSSSNMYELLGMDLVFGGMSANVNYNTNSALLAQYNISYGYNNTDAVAGDIDVAGFSGPFTGTMTTVADGTGTLDLNGITILTNCLKLKTTQSIGFNLAFGVISGTLDQTTYNFYHSSSKFPVFTASYIHVSASGAFPIDQTQTQISTLSNIVIGVKENKLNDVIFKTYPNPANNEVNLYFVLSQPESYKVEISNTLGQIVKTISLNNLQPGVFNEPINTNDLSAGIYTIKVTGKNKQGSEKLVIQK